MTATWVSPHIRAMRLTTATTATAACRITATAGSTRGTSSCEATVIQVVMGGITSGAIVAAEIGRDSHGDLEADAGIPAFALVAAVAIGNAPRTALLPNE